MRLENVAHKLSSDANNTYLLVRVSVFLQDQLLSHNLILFK